MKSILAVATALALSLAAQAAGPRVLFLSKSAGFQHSVIAVQDNQPSHAGKHLTEIVAGLGGTITSTKDASLINKDNLKNYDVVICFTTGDLTTPGTDGQPPMGPNGQAELVEWVKGGGGFIGYHCASDTFHPDPACGPPTPFIELVGGEFSGHGRQFEGIIKVTSPGHPLVANITDGWKIADEWYTFCNYNYDKLHVLAVLDPGEERSKQKMYDRPAYPIIWCREIDKGRMYYSAMGHREDVWDNEQFRKTVADAITWTDGKGDAAATPNFATAAPEEAARK